MARCLSSLISMSGVVCQLLVWLTCHAVLRHAVYDPSLCGVVQELYVDHNRLETLPLSLTKLTNLRRL